MDPQKYLEGIEVVFDEPMREIKVLSTDPEFLYTTELAENGKVFHIRFVDYTMPNGTEFKIELRAWDLVGNEIEVIYSFTTI